ncbi:MAG: hypothetical protein GY697_13180, partial [Desulfobacterales bacterium]|nr:hypothetical protein [Desulfobacterales bacterium]
MKTQISRDSFHTDKRYSGVYQQQGRMLVDADWNELVDIVKHRLDDALKDVVNNGAPLHNGIIDFSTDPPQIRWGSVYAAGIKAELLPRIEAGSPVPATFDFTQQQDFPGVDTIAPSGDYQLYADIWERPVISIEDETLRDPGLHGADTCTRTRTMVQVKWCADTIDPETDIAQNPKKGDALLDLSLRETGTGDGDGDPCGNEITTIDQKTGNHLFRLEAHDVTGDPGNPDAIVLKWSSENGAEQHVVREDGTLTDTVPTEFTTGDWIYEQYNDTSETHVGVHLASASGFPARFDLITDGFPASIASDAQYIRRWDGCCTLTQNGTWSVQGKDGAVELTEISASTPDENATHGDVKFESGQVKIFLNNMVLTLDLTGKTFVAGDFWLAMVRDNTEEDDRIQMVSKGPVGINHHYINIAQFQSDAIVLPDNKETRKFSFPALSNLTADKVGYDPATTQARWTDIHDNPAIPMPLTVQRAIDDLVENLESSDISYLIPSCSAPLSIREMLPSIQGLADDAEQKINEILDALLCELRAATLPCEDRGADISVQDALDNRVHNDGDTMTGKLTIQSDLEVTRNVGIGTASPAAQLHVSGGADTSLTTHGLMVLGNINGDNISFDANEIMARDNGASAPLYFNHNGGQVIVNGSGPGNMSIGTAADSGDRLNINGSLRATGFRMTTSPQDNYVLTSDATGVGTWQPS